MSSKSKSKSESAAPTASAAPLTTGLVVTASSSAAAYPALDDAVAGLSLGSDSLALPSLTANPHTPFTPFHAAAPDSFGVGDNEVYRSLGAGADALGDAPVFRSVGALSGSSQYEDTGSFVTASGAGGSGVHAPSLSVIANPFQPISLASEFGHKKAAVATAPTAASGSYTFTLNPKYDAAGAAGAAGAAADADVLPPEVPGYLEPAFHFALAPALRATDFFSVLLPLLAASRVDFAAPLVAADRACKVKCVAYGGGASAGVGRVPFVVSVFRLDKTGHRLVVEFQRRSGCVMTFCTLYRAVRRELQQKGALLVTLPAAAGADATTATTAAAAAASRFTEVSVVPTPADLPAVDGGDVSSERAKKSVELLLGMVASEFTDVKVKAIQMLADLTAADAAGSAAYCEALACSAGPDGAVHAAVLKCLSHANEDVQRCAVTAVANLTTAKRAAVCSAVVGSAHFAGLSGVFAQPNASVQTVREAARALANISETVGFGAQGLNATAVRAAAAALGASSDATARLHFTRISHALAAAGHSSPSLSAASGSGSAGKAFALPQELSLPSLALSRK